MMRRFLLLFLTMFFCCGQLFAGWQENVSALLDRGFNDIATASCREMSVSPDEICKAVKEIKDSSLLLDFLQRREFKPAAKRGELNLFNLAGKDGVSRPWVLYVPENYYHKRPTALLVALHGGVSRTTISEDPLGWAKESEWLQLARQNGCFALFPFGQEKATWWDETGMDNIRRQLHLVKHHYNIDDNRVYLVGFSDGASAGFLHAMIRPDNFAAVIALNGHMGVGSLDGGLPTYAPNMAQTPVYAVTTDKDGLYPTSMMAPTISMAIKSGADIFYRQLAGEHEFSYAAKELPRIGRFIDQHPRNCMPGKIFWETALPEFGRCRWLSIESILPEPAAEWHGDHNLAMVSDRVSIGFMPKKAENGIGVRNVTDGSYASTAGMKADDVIIRAAGREIRTLADLDEVKAKLCRGDYLETTVRRASETIELKGYLPAPELYFLFKREVPSAAVKAVQIGNRFFLTGSRAGRLRLLLQKDQLNFANPVEVFYNDRQVYSGLVVPDSGLILSEYLQNRDREMLAVAAIDLDLRREK
ncbi:MAG: PDZ domain-containing protein [Candidatus Riflebacteria bacterium]